MQARVDIRQTQLHADRARAEALADGAIHGGLGCGRQAGVPGALVARFGHSLSAVSLDVIQLSEEQFRMLGRLTNLRQLSISSSEVASNWLLEGQPLHRKPAGTHIRSTHRSACA